MTHANASLALIPLLYNIYQFDFLFGWTDFMANVYLYASLSLSLLVYNFYKFYLCLFEIIQ